MTICDVCGAPTNDHAMTCVTVIIEPESSFSRMSTNIDFCDACYKKYANAAHMLIQDLVAVEANGEPT